MSRTRIDFDNYIRNATGCNNIYFQPKSNVKMSYPAITYSINDIDNKNANNAVYLQYTQYQVIVIDKNPDSQIRNAISKMPISNFERQYTANDLYHNVFTIKF